MTTPTPSETRDDSPYSLDSTLGSLDEEIQLSHEGIPAFDAISAMG